jgi:hypothetical protein
MIMRTIASPHFEPISLALACNADRGAVSEELAAAFGEAVFKGIPFALEPAGRPNAIVLSPGGPEVRIELPPTPATYLVFLHAVEDRPIPIPPGFGQVGLTPNGGGMDGNELGDHVADYVLIDSDGNEHATAIRRRFAIQQRHISWGASPFAAVPAFAQIAFSSSAEDYALDR